MIQRKQTLYLLLSGLLMLLPLFLPILMVGDTAGGAFYDMNASGFLSPDGSGTLVYPAWFLFALDLLIILLSFIAIFLYNKRTLQMRMTMFNLLLKVGFYGLVAYYAFSHKGDFGSAAELSIRVWLAAPILGTILDYLAHRAIAIDDRTIRFMDRLR